MAVVGTRRVAAFFGPAAGVWAAASSASPSCRSSTAHHALNDAPTLLPAGRRRCWRACACTSAGWHGDVRARRCRRRGRGRAPSTSPHRWRWSWGWPCCSGCWSGASTSARRAPGPRRRGRRLPGRPAAPEPVHRCWRPGSSGPTSPASRRRRRRSSSVRPARPGPATRSPCSGASAWCRVLLAAGRPGARLAPGPRPRAAPGRLPGAALRRDGHRRTAASRGGCCRPTRPWPSSRRTAPRGRRTRCRAPLARGSCVRPAVRAGRRGRAGPARGRRGPQRPAADCAPTPAPRRWPGSWRASRRGTDRGEPAVPGSYRRDLREAGFELYPVEPALPGLRARPPAGARRRLPRRGVVLGDGQRPPARPRPRRRPARGDGLLPTTGRRERRRPPRLARSRAGATHRATSPTTSASTTTRPRTTDPDPSSRSAVSTTAGSSTPTRGTAHDAPHSAASAATRYAVPLLAAVHAGARRRPDRAGLQGAELGQRRAGAHRVRRLAGRGPAADDRDRHRRRPGAVPGHGRASSAGGTRSTATSGRPTTRRCSTWRWCPSGGRSRTTRAGWSSRCGWPTRSASRPGSSSWACWPASWCRGDRRWRRWRWWWRLRPTLVLRSAFFQ